MITVVLLLLVMGSMDEKWEKSKVQKMLDAPLNINVLVGPAAAGEDGMIKGRLTVDGEKKDSQSCPSTKLLTCIAHLLLWGKDDSYLIEHRCFHSISPWLRYPMSMINLGRD